MPRFSQKAKEIFEEIWYQGDVNKAKKLTQELKDPRDIVFVKIWLARDLLVFKGETEFLEILSKLENENKELNDQFIQFLIYYLYILYYSGFNVPVIDSDQAKKCLNNMEETYQTFNYLDDWEKYFIEGWYYYSKAFYSYKININFSDAIKFQKMCIDSFSNVPQDGKFLSEYNHLAMGLYYMEDGHFEEAEKSYKISLGVTVKYNQKMHSWLMNNLSFLNFLKGDLHAAKEYNKKSLKIAKQDNNLSVITYGLTRKAMHLEVEGNYDDAFKAHQDSLIYRKQLNEPFIYFSGYYYIFHFYYSRYKVTRNKEFLALANKAFIDLQELSRIHSDNKTIVNLTTFAKSLILKQGSIVKKGKAISILQKLIEEDSSNIFLSLELLEVLFEDAVLSDDEDTISQIDEIMLKLAKIPLRNNPQAIFGFISQQIIIAKFHYYIKGDLSLALEILNDTKDRMKVYQLHNLGKQIENEIDMLHGELTKWDHVDTSIRNRIKKSEFGKYITQALNTADKQM